MTRDQGGNQGQRTSTSRQLGDLRQPQHRRRRSSGPSRPAGPRRARVRDLQRRRGDEALLGTRTRTPARPRSAGMRGRRDRDDIEERPHGRRYHADQCGHAHVLATLESQHGAQHGEPQEQDRGQLVRPDERRVEDVARDHARRAARRPRRRRAAPPGSRPGAGGPIRP